MSYDLTDVVFEMDLPNPEKALLLALAHCQNGQTRRCDPSIDRLRRLTGLCKNSVKLARKKLCASGLIEFRSTNGRRSSTYRLHINRSRHDPLNGSRHDPLSDAVDLSNGSPHDPQRVTRRPVNGSPHDPEQGSNKERTRKKKKTSSGGASRKPCKKAVHPLMKMSDLPAWLPAQSWSDWRLHREEIRKPMTPTAERNLIAVLDRMRAAGHNLENVITTAIASGWQGIRPEYFDNRGKRNEQRNVHAAAADNTEQLLRELDAAERARNFAAD